MHDQAHDELDEGAVFHLGVELFNAGQWFDAHEAWEDIWVLASGERKRFYQGLIQCAVTLEHISRGNPRGVRSVWASCLPKFDGLPAEYLGVPVTQLLADMRHVVAPILNLPASRFDPALPRGQELPFDPAQAPRIELTHDPFAQQ